MSIKSLINLCRPQQWSKNVFLFLPMFFGGQLGCVHCWYQSIIAFFAFSFMASAIYCFNDVIDIKYDRLHPLKCKRPVASGEVSIYQAIALMAALITASFTLSFLALNGHNTLAAGIIAAYLLLNISYCLRLKQIAIIDVFTIAIGFVLRLLVGGVVCGIVLSPWIVAMTFLLALFLAFAKRRDDFLLWEANGMSPRRAITRYNLAFLNQTLGILASVTIVCYILYTVSPEVVNRLGSQYVYVTAVFVLAGILRYLQATIVDSRSGSPTKILYTDHFIHVCIIGYIITFFIILYL